MRRACLLAVSILGFLALATVLAPAPARADGGGGGGTVTPAGKPEDADYLAGVKAIRANDFRTAIPLLERAVSRDGKNADAYNWLGYATRRNGNAAGSIPHYQKALQVDPKHRGAHEYIGEAYLQLDDVAKAKQHLATLRSLCFMPCSEYADLKKAVDAYEQSGGKIKPASN